MTTKKHPINSNGSREAKGRLSRVAKVKARSVAEVSSYLESLGCGTDNDVIVDLAMKTAVQVGKSGDLTGTKNIVNLAISIFFGQPASKDEVSYQSFMNRVRLCIELAYKTTIRDIDKAASWNLYNGVHDVAKKQRKKARKLELEKEKTLSFFFTK